MAKSITEAEMKDFCEPCLAKNTIAKLRGSFRPGFRTSIGGAPTAAPADLEGLNDVAFHQAYVCLVESFDTALEAPNEPCAITVKKHNTGEVRTLHLDKAPELASGVIKNPLLVYRAGKFSLYDWEHFNRSHVFLEYPL